MLLQTIHNIQPAVNTGKQDFLVYAVTRIVLHYEVSCATDRKTPPFCLSGFKNLKFSSSTLATCNVNGLGIIMLGNNGIKIMNRSHY